MPPPQSRQPVGLLLAQIPISRLQLGGKAHDRLREHLPRFGRLLQPETFEDSAQLCTALLRIRKLQRPVDPLEDGAAQWQTIAEDNLQTDEVVIDPAPVFLEKGIVV